MLEPGLAPYNDRYNQVMSQRPSLSIGIPAYNQGEFLEETLASLLKQTVMPAEIVISDHFSTDDTPQIISRYQQQYPHLVRGVEPPPGSNLTAQYNFTLSAQTGDWITLLSSDDVARPNFCEVLLRGATRKPNAAAIRAGWENIDANGNVVSTEYMLSVPAIEEFPQTLLRQRHGPMVSFAAFALRREAWQKMGGILDTMESLSDWALFAQMTPFGPFIYEAEIISGYRVGHDGDKFRTRAAMWIRDEQRIFYEVLPRAAKQGGFVDLARIDEASRANFMRYLASASERFSTKERELLIPDLRPWAERTNGLRALEDFSRGERIKPETTLQERVKSVVRPVAQRLYRGLKRQ